MKAFLRENPTIVFGLGLPLLLVTVFLLVSGIPALLVAAPQYDVLYATEYYDYPNGVQISVVDRQVQVIYQGKAEGYPRPHIWRYNPKTGAVKEVAIIFPAAVIAAEKKQAAGVEALPSTLLEVPDLKGLTVDSSSIAPDGYEFRSGTGLYSRSVFTELFYASRNRHQAVLTKSGRNIRLPNSAGQYYSRNTRFIGWVLPL